MAQGGSSGRGDRWWERKCIFEVEAGEVHGLDIVDVRS